MRRAGKSGGIPHDEIRVHYLKVPNQAHVAFNLALKEFKADGNVSALLETLRLINRAQGGIA